MLRRLYDWTMSLAGRPTAEIWLAIIAFVESSVFPVPADVLFVPMVIARPERAWRYATVATVASVLGGILGWYIGHYAFDSIARPILGSKLDSFEALRSSATSHNAVLLLLITSGIAHLPPIKIVTILAGYMHVDLGLFIASAIMARGARFFVLGWLIQRYDDFIRAFLEKRLAQVAAAVVVAIFLLFAATRFL